MFIIAADGLQDDKKPAGETIPAPIPKKAGILKPSPVPSRASSQSTAEEEIASEPRKSIGSQDVIDQLAKEMGNHTVIIWPQCVCHDCNLLIQNL